MKYLAETPDGAVFETEQECRNHEKLYKDRNIIREEVDHFLNLTEKSDKAKAVARGHIMEWIEYDLRQRPERYQIPVPPPVAVVSEAG